MHELVQTDLEELDAVRLLVDVRNRDEPVLVRLVHDRGPNLRRDLQARLRDLVDPHLRVVDTEGRLLTHHGTRLFLRRRRVRETRVEAARVGEAQAGSERARQIRPSGVRLQHQGYFLRTVRADAPGRRDAVVELRPQRLLGRLHRAAVVGVQVDEAWDDRLAGSIDHLRAVRHLDGVARAGRPDAAVVDQDYGVGHGVAAGAVDEPGTDDRQVGGLYRLGISAASREEGDRQERES